MSQAEQLEQALLSWFEDHARPFLEEHAKDRLASVDNDRDRLRKLLERTDRITVCFIGNSGIGKSTLLNALCAGERQVVPAGGIGPLTAQATEIHFSETPSFTVWYHKRKMLWRIGFALEQRLDHVNKPKKGEKNKDGGFHEELNEEEKKDILDEVATQSNDEDPTRDPTEDYTKQARQIVTGNQFNQKPLQYLTDALRQACGYKMRWNSALDPEDLGRIARVKEILELAKSDKPVIAIQSDDPRVFTEKLTEHAAGFLSPLIQRIEVYWSSDLLKHGIVLVDLPGVGIAQDTYREITKRYVREQARAIVLVVDHRGPTEATIELLRNSGYWDRLVGAADDPKSDPCYMLIAVTRVDDVANSEWTETAHLPREQRPKKKAVFAGVVERLKPNIQGQLTAQLGRITSNDNETVQHARETAVKYLLERLEIHPISAPEYRKLRANDEEDPPFLPDIATTGIPELSRSMVRLCEQDRLLRRQALQEVSERLFRSIVGELQIVRSQWQDRDRAAAEAEKLRLALDVMLGPKEKEYLLRIGAFREFLEATVQTKIRELVLEARSVAEAEVNNYLIELRSERWNTLRAAVRRGGVWLYGRGRVINLPDDITNYFQEPMAAVWGQKLLKVIRKRTSELADDISMMVEQICVWARDNGGAQVNASLLERQQQRVTDQVAQLRQVGKEAVDELRNVVKQKLMDVIKKPVKKACEDFVARGDDIGLGVKLRILELFETLAKRATTAAEKPAIEVLQFNFSEVREEIRVAFEEWGDPLQETANLIVEKQEDRLKRSDAQRRGKILAEVEEIIAMTPPSMASVSDQIVRTGQ
jgi:GTP-binding protein EngB required for normal cell division